MTGLTIIHLSDFHMGKGHSGNWPQTADDRFPPDERENLTAEAKRLVEDFVLLRDSENVPFRTEELLLLVTGDITHQCQWWQFEMALWLLWELGRMFKERFPGQRLMPSRILCIPGNHDLRLPSAGQQTPAQAPVDKYCDFKLFLDLVTNYAQHARTFRLTAGATKRKVPSPTNIAMTVPGPVQLCVVDLNSCMGVNCLCDGNHPDKMPGFTRNSLDFARQLLSSRTDAIRVAVMHHSIDDMPSEEDTKHQRVHRRFLETWLGENRVKFLLTGHSHAQKSGMQSDDLGGGAFVMRTTGPSLPHKPGDECTYEVLRLEPHKKPEVYKRALTMPSTGVCSWRSVRSDQTHHSINLPWKHLTEGIAPNLSEGFLGCSGADNWAVISHCESGKFQNYGLMSPGETINAILIRHFGSVRGNLVRVVGKYDIEYPPGTEESGKHTTAWPIFDKNCVFLVDSPRYNPYVAWILDHYGAHLAGARIQFPDNLTANPRRQEIVVSGRAYASDRPQSGGLFGKYTDYLLVMRLPGVVPSRPESMENRQCPDLKKTIWVVAGIHSKASQAGTALFDPTNLPTFVQSLVDKCDGEVPPYFEAVYEIPAELRKPVRDQKGFDFLKKPVYFGVLRPKTQIALADGQPPGLAARFRSNANWAEIPLEIVHLDPVAACNHQCPGCIEGNLRGQKLFLSLPTCLKVLCDFKSVGCHRVNLYGGEPTLHPAFPELLRTMSAMGFETLMVTNGSRLCKEEVAAAIIDCRNNVQLRVSMDACCAETHATSHNPPENRSFDEITAATKRLIAARVHTTISILLRPHVVACEHFAEKCREWERVGAQALSLRPMTEAGGKTPFIGYDIKDCENLLHVLEKLGETGFAHTPEWFSNALRDRKSGTAMRKPPQSKEYRACYSAYYRMVVSPLANGASSEPTEICGVPMSETSKAHVAWCSYRRTPMDDPEGKFGADYPDDLSSWLREGRLHHLQNVTPCKDCLDVFCCRDSLNRELHESIA